MVEILNNNNNNDHDEQEDNSEGIREGESSVGGSRWNPTKEQIEMLEKMYSHEGVRTPNAEQIQRITSRLRVYGHIEGKNVFYWFQNHKARQRQKQRQERIANANANANADANYRHNRPINRFIGHYHGYNGGVNGANPMMIVPPTHYPCHYVANPNVIYGQYYGIPQTNDIGFHSPHHNYNAAHNKRSSTSTKNGCNPIMEMPAGNGIPNGSNMNGYYAMMMKGHYDNNMGARTLDLFPVHPTGILEHKLVGTSSINNSSPSENRSFGDEKHQNLFDFFSS